MRASRWVALVGVTTVAVGCRSSQRITIPDDAAARPALSEWVGRRLVLRHAGDRGVVAVKPGEAPKGTCDVAVEVTAVDPVPSGVQFALASLGRLRLGDGSTIGSCKAPVARVTLTLKPADAARPDSWRGFLETILMTPEAYISTNGRTLNLSAATGDPKVVADPSTMADVESRKLARRVTVWPKPVFAVEPAFASPGGKVRHEGEVAFEAVIAADGRVLHPKVTTSLNEEQTKHVVTVLDLWRFEPAREGDKAIAARYEGRTVLRVY
jgi:hypothetical protein